MILGQNLRFLSIRRKRHPSKSHALTEQKRAFASPRQQAARSIRLAKSKPPVLPRYRLLTRARLVPVLGRIGWIVWPEAKEKETKL